MYSNVDPYLPPFQHTPLPHTSMFVALYTMMWKYKVTKFKLLDVHETLIHQPPPPSPFDSMSVALSTWLQKDRLTTELPITLGVGWVISLSTWLSIGTVVILGGRVIHFQSHSSINLSLSVWLTNWTVVILGEEGVGYTLLVSLFH